MTISETVAMVIAMKTVPEMTPVEVDTELARIYAQRSKHYSQMERIRRILSPPPASGVPANKSVDYQKGSLYLEQMERSLEVHLLAVSALAQEAFPYEEEYLRRPWQRYYLVQNDNGHVHRDMSCSTCFPTTLYAWLVDLADKPVDAMIEEWGERVCTVCFPSAPTNPLYNRPARVDREERARRDSEKAEREAKKAAKNLTPAEYFKDCGEWEVTTVAGAKQALREAAALKAGFGYQHQMSLAPGVYEAAREVLLARGLSVEELETLEERAVKRAKKEWS